MEKKRIEEAIKVWQDRLNLKHWKIEVQWDELEPDGIFMSITPMEGRNYAKIRVSNAFYKQTPQEQSIDIAHELIHTLLDRLSHQIRYLTKNMSEDMKQAIYDMLVLEIEYVTDHLSMAIGECLPIPESLFYLQDKTL